MSTSSLSVFMNQFAQATGLEYLQQFWIGDTLNPEDRDCIESLWAVVDNRRVELGRLSAYLSERLQDGCNEDEAEYVPHLEGFVRDCAERLSAVGVYKLPILDDNLLPSLIAQ